MTKIPCARGRSRAFGRAAVWVAFFTATLVSPSVAAPLLRGASPDQTIQLPRDHGSHPEFETEWWYYTGHLVPEGDDVFTSDRRIGVQLTFFRRARRDGRGELTQSYLAHAAVADVTAGNFTAGHRLAGDALGLAGAALGRLKVWHLDWFAELFGDRHVLAFGLPVNAPTTEVRLIGEGGSLMLQGEAGFSRKSDCASCASMYYSVPRIAVRGHIARGGTVEPVHGLVWMDHEYMTNVLQPGQAGWDWVSLMFRDGTNLMAFRIRDHAGREVFSSGGLERAGVFTALSAGDLRLTPLSERWRSPTTGGEYPTAFRITVPNHNIDTTLRSLLPAQEVPGDDGAGIAYYEGAVRNEERTAIGYLEMTGYARPLDKDL